MKTWSVYVITSNNKKSNLSEGYQASPWLWESVGIPSTNYMMGIYAANGIPIRKIPPERYRPFQPTPPTVSLSSPGLGPFWPNEIF